ncbi:MAG: OmpA family protein [Pyrinomonadaceae bacterium]|nr:OmpA family protein [Pyrinomonadaceae bacterium]
MATSAILTEDNWAKAHPVPESSVSDDLLMLWNYPVAKPGLSTVHKNAIQRFLATEWLKGAQNSPVELTVHGHASDTGDPKLNESLARERAEDVARFLRSQGVRSKLIFVSSAGSAEPFDSESSGLAFAKNRRVDVTKHMPARPEAPLPPLDTGPPGPPSPAPPQPSPAGSVLPGLSSTWIEWVIPARFPTYPTAEVIIDTTIEFTVKVKADDKGGGLGVGAPINGGILKLEQPIRDWLMSKITFEREIGKPATLKFGGELSTVTLKPEIGGSNPANPYVKLTFGESPPFDTVLNGIHISLKVSGKIKFDLLPGPAMVARGLRLAAAIRAAPLAAGTAAGAVAGAVVVAALINGGIIYLIHQAKEEADAFTHLLAQREGASSRVARIIIGIDAEAAFRERRARWANPQSNLVPAFDDGRQRLDAMLGKADELAARAKAWKARFANDGTEDFTMILERVFRAVGAYNNEPDISDGLAAAL